MLYKQETIHVNNQANDVEMTLYLLDNNEEVDENRVRPLVIICPGGGYEFRSFREAEPVAVRLLSMGYHAAVLQYDVAPQVFPSQLLQLLASIHHVRANAENWHVDPDRIVLMGFSAGGHLAASAGVFWMRPYYAQLLGLTNEDVRPNALVLAYPVITSGPFTHQGSMDNLMGEDREKYLYTVSLEKQVKPEVPPTFLWHTVEDTDVPVENSMMFASALRKAGVPFEMHLYQKGEHGLSLSNEEVYGPAWQHNITPACQGWLQMMDIWYRNL